MVDEDEQEDGHITVAEGVATVIPSLSAAQAGLRLGESGLELFGAAAVERRDRFLTARHPGPFELARGPRLTPAGGLGGDASARSSVSSGARLCKVNPRPAIRSSSPWRCEGSMIVPVISVLPSWAESVIPSKADA